MPISNQWGNSAVDATRKNALPPYIDEALENFSSGINLEGEAAITWIESKDNWPGEGLQLLPEFSGASDSNMLQIRGSTEGAAEPSWSNIMTLTAKSGNLTIKGGGVFGDDVYVGSTSATAERDLYVQAQSGGIVLYSEGTTNGKRGLWMQKHGTGSAGDIIAVDTNNNITYTGGSVSGILNISGNSTVGGTLRAAKAITVTEGGIIVTAGNIQATAGHIYAANNHLYAGATSNTADRRVHARSGAGVIYLFSKGTTDGTRGIHAEAHGSGSAQDLIWANTNNTIYLNAGARMSSANNDATRIRNISCQNSAGTTTSTNYLITRRLS